MLCMMILSLDIECKSTVIGLLWHDTLKRVIIPFGRNKFKMNPSALNKNVNSYIFILKQVGDVCFLSQMLVPSDHMP